MWNEHDRQRFRELRERQRTGLLAPAEQAELAALVGALEAAEAAYLGPATENLRQERQALETQNRALEDLVRRKEALARRLHDFLVETRAERQAIEGELAAVLAGTRSPQTDR